jgi:hypothetical protein
MILYGRPVLSTAGRVSVIHNRWIINLQGLFLGSEVVGYVCVCVCVCVGVQCVCMCVSRFIRRSDPFCGAKILN